jgi:hypothetical protein
MTRNRNHRQCIALPGMARSRRAVSLAPLLAMLISVCLTSLSHGQQYQADPVDENAGKLKLTAEQCVKNPTRLLQDRPQFVEFFDKYYFPAMTRFETNDLAQLGRMREDLFGRFLWATTDESLQHELTQMAFKKMQPVERSAKYHPAVRYNAVLILGMLDQTYAAPGRPPVPLKEANAELTMIVDFAAQGKRVPPFLVVGALVGLERHAQYHDALDRATLEAMTAAVLKLATKDEPLPEIEPKVSDWIRIQAATVLANAGSPGAEGEVAAALAKLIAGQTTPKMALDARTQVAALLQKIKFDGGNFDGKALADALLQLSLEVGNDEAKEAKSFEDMQMQGGGYSGSYGTQAHSKGRMKMNAQTQMWEYDARILLSRLADLKAGLGAFRAAAPADKQPIVDAILAAMAPAATAASSADTVDLAVAGKVVTMGEQIRAAVKPGSAPAEGADTAGVF